MAEASEKFVEAMNRAVQLNDQKNKICTDLIRKMVTPTSKFNPNHGAQAIAKTFLLAGAKLSGQIIDAARIGHLQIAIVGLRPLFELMVHSKYIYNHPKHRKDRRHMQRVAKDIIRLTNKKRPTNHSKVDGKRLHERIKELDLMHLYRSLYRALSEWSHLGIRTPYLSDQTAGEKYGMNISSISLCLIHDVIDSICEGFGFEMDKQWDREVVQFRDAYQKQF